MSLFRFGFTRKSLDTVAKSEDIQATQQLNSTKLKEPGDKRKAESQPEVFVGKSGRDRKSHLHGSVTFLGSMIDRVYQSKSLRSPQQKAYHMYCKRHSSMTVLITMK